ncbi:MAG: hypothetical protein KDD69_16565 [Bdellovibrionales bacterium]|nr:hypothetical protein [Bdellovibrionales bacterium]
MKVLFIGDPNLGDAGFSVVQRCFPQAQSFIWRKGDQRGKVEVRKAICATGSDVCISFYSDLVLRECELLHTGVTLNIHPALPTVPGLGYDTIPLIENHSNHGATAHLIDDAGLDSGPIFDVEERPLPEGCCYLELRQRNQAACLALLERAVNCIATCRTPDELRDCLLKSASRCGWNWGDCYITEKEHRRRIGELLARDPQHPALRDNPLVPALLGTNGSRISSTVH